MDWTAIGALGEIIGAVAVVLSLVYVARQVQANTSAVRSAAYTSVASDVASQFSTFSQDESLSRLWGEVLEGGLTRADLEVGDRYRLGFATLAILNTWQNAYIQAEREGLIDLEAVTQMFSSRLTKSAFFQEFWEQNRGELSPGFVAFFESGRSLSAGSDV